MNILFYFLNLKNLPTADAIVYCCLVGYCHANNKKIQIFIMGIKKLNRNIAIRKFLLKISYLFQL